MDAPSDVDLWLAIVANRLIELRLRVFRSSQARYRASRFLAGIRSDYPIKRNWRMAETIGFLSVRRHAEHGYFGGYLILNFHARPLEFHCTMPVKPSRAQELLYGPTIDDFVCGEQIAKALTTKAKLKPTLILTDCVPVLAVSVVSNLEAAMLECASVSSVSAGALSIPTSRAEVRRVVVRGLSFGLPMDSDLSETTLDELLSKLAASFELDEPFQRITEALLEAHPIAKAA